MKTHLPRFTAAAAFGAALAIATSAIAQAPAAPPRPSYGPTVTLEVAKKAAAAAVAEAKKNHWAMAVAVVDNHGMLIYYEMDDDTQTAGATIAIEKARTAAMFRRPSKVFEDAIAAGRVSYLGLPGVTPIEGGVPLVVGGKVIGGIGASGSAAPDDAQVCKAGADAIK